MARRCKSPITPDYRTPETAPDRDRCADVAILLKRSSSTTLKVPHHVTLDRSDGSAGDIGNVNEGPDAASFADDGKPPPTDDWVKRIADEWLGAESGHKQTARRTAD
jgi:hypothetical protein